MRTNIIFKKLNHVNNSTSIIKDFPVFHALTNLDLYKEYILSMTLKKVDFRKLNKCSGLKIKTTFSREDIYNDKF